MIVYTFKQISSTRLHEMQMFYGNYKRSWDPTFERWRHARPALLFFRFRERKKKKRYKKQETQEEEEEEEEEGKVFGALGGS